jgi:hypothetical protein
MLACGLVMPITLKASLRPPQTLSDKPLTWLSPIIKILRLLYATVTAPFRALELTLFDNGEIALAGSLMFFLNIHPFTMLGIE